MTWLILLLPLLAQDLQQHMEAGAARHKAQDYGGAAAEYTSAIALDGTHAAAYAGRALARYMNRDFEGAIEDYGKVIELEPEDLSPLYARGMALQYLKRHRDAVLDFTRLVESGDTRFLAAALVKRGDSKRELADVGGALEDYDLAVEADPRHFEAYRSSGKVHEMAGNFTGAVEVYTKALKINPNWGEVYIDRARARAFLHDYKGSDDDFESALFHKPDDIGILATRARIRMLRGDLAGALADCGKAISVDGKNYHPYYTRGQIRYNFGDYRRARLDLYKALKRVTNFEPDYVQLYMCLVRIRMRQKDRGVKDLKAYYVSKKKKPDPWFAKVVGFMTGELGEADFLAAAKGDTPKQTRERQCEAWFYAGTLRLVAGDKAAARTYFLKVVATGVTDYIEYETATVELKALG